LPAVDEVQGFITGVLLSLTSWHPHGRFQSPLGLESWSEFTKSCLIIYPGKNIAEIDEMNDYYYSELTGIQMLNDAPKWIFKETEVHSNCVTPSYTWRHSSC